MSVTTIAIVIATVVVVPVLVLVLVVVVVVVVVVMVVVVIVVVNGTWIGSVHALDLFPIPFRSDYVTPKMAVSLHPAVGKTSYD